VSGGGGLEGGDWVGLEFGLFVEFVFAHAFEEEVGDGLLLGTLAVLGDGGEGAVGGVLEDLVYGFEVVGGGGFGEVGGGDLERVEEEAGAFGVEQTGGDALDDDADGGLDGAAVLGERELEGGDEGWGGFGFAGGVVEVAEGLAAEALAAAAVAVGEDVTALEGLVEFGGHGGVSPWYGK
jgi:hypothetical protein